MKLLTIKNAGALALILSFVFIGCSTKPALYSYTADQARGASVSFGATNENPNITFMALDCVPPETAEKGTHWEPIVLPAGRTLRITVHANYTQKGGVKFGGFGLIGDIANTAQAVSAVTRDVDTDVIFNCPPLEAGKTYRLTFSKEPGIPGRNVLILTDVNSREIIYQEEFETYLLGGQAK